MMQNEDATFGRLECNSGDDVFETQECAFDFVAHVDKRIKADDGCDEFLKDFGFIHMFPSGL
jgi:hypothetical protein